MLTQDNLRFIDQELEIIHDSAQDWSNPDFLADLASARCAVRETLAISFLSDPMTVLPIPLPDDIGENPRITSLKMRHRLTTLEIRDLLASIFTAGMYALGDIAFVVVAFMAGNVLIALACGFTLRHTLHLDREAFAEARRMIVYAWKRTRWQSYDDFMREADDATTSH